MVNGFFDKSTELLVSDSGLDITQILSLDALPLGGRISKCYDNWQRIVSNDWVLSVVREGYKIPLKCKPVQKSVPKNPKPKGPAAFEILVKEANDLKLKNAVTVVEHCPDEYVSSYFAVPKPHRDNQFRPILNLKYFNNFVKKYKFSMESLKSVKEWIRPGYFCTSLDIKDAFLHISINPSSRKFLRFNWLGELLEWCSLVFGLTSSPRVITKVLKPVMSFIRTRFGILVTIYIDDLLIQSISFEKCVHDTQVVILILLSLGWSVKWEKCSLIPSRQFVHLGFLFDTEAMSLTCPEDKVERIRNTCMKILSAGSSTVLGLEKLLGTLESVRPAVPLAALNLRSLQKQLLLAKKFDRIASKVITISKESSLELSWWIKKFPINCTAPIRELQPTVQIYSDANLLMGGSHCSRGKFLQRAWSKEELSQDLHINLLEIRAAREALALAEPGDLVRLHIDSRTAASYIRRQGGTKSSLLSAEACQLWREAVSKSDNLDPTLALDIGQCNGRLLISPRNESVGVHVITLNPQYRVSNLPIVSDVGRVCQQGDTPAPKVHELVPRPGGSGQGCHDAQMGRCVISFSPSANVIEDPPEDQTGRDQSCDDTANVANIPLVEPHDRNAGGAAPPPAVLQDHRVHDRPNEDLAVPGPSRGSPSKSSALSPDNDLQSFLSNHLSKGTNKGYQSSFSRFEKFCQTVGACSLSCPPHVIANYLKYMYDAGNSYSTVNHTRSAISKYHHGYNGSPAGQDQTVCQALRAVFRLRPPLPKYMRTFDASVVLCYLKSLGPNQNLSFKDLTFKALFLLTCATISRMSSAANLGREFLVFKVGFIF